MERAKLLKKLYTAKYFGYDYFDDIKPTVPMNSTSVSSLDEIKKEVFACHLCELVKSKKNYVFGEGNPDAKLMFVGEAPGFYEDEMGKPFVGRAGEMLTNIIKGVFGFSRDDVYIANIVKCRPPNNATPSEEIADSCKGYLFKQIEVVKPKVIVALGSVAYRYLTGDKSSAISKIRGNVLSYNGIKLIPTFHPSFLLRNPSAKKFVFVDMKIVKELL